LFAALTFVHAQSAASSDIQDFACQPGHSAAKPALDLIGFFASLGLRRLVVGHCFALQKAGAPCRLSIAGNGRRRGGDGDKDSTEAGMSHVQNRTLGKSNQAESKRQFPGRNMPADIWVSALGKHHRCTRADICRAHSTAASGLRRRQLGLRHRGRAGRLASPRAM
jgi:hypothetical protein